MRRVLATTFFPILSVLLLAAVPGEASIINVQWSGPSEDAWDAAEEGDGTVEDTESYRHCRVQFGPYCHYFWNQGLAAGELPGGFPPELFVSGFGEVGFGMNVYQSMPNFFIFADCKPGLFEPCYSTFTPMSIDWDFYGGTGDLAPFVWESSKGGTLTVGGDWDGRFLGPEWQNVQWISGEYGCLDDPELECTDDFYNPYIRGMTIRVPEPGPLFLLGLGICGVALRRRE